MRIGCTMDNYHIFGTQEVTLDNDALWANSSVAFENGDGTRYLFHFMPARHGGIYIIANEKNCIDTMVSRTSSFCAVITTNIHKEQYYS